MHHITTGMVVGRFLGDLIGQRSYFGVFPLYLLCKTCENGFVRDRKVDQHFRFGTLRNIKSVSIFHIQQFPLLKKAISGLIISILFLIPAFFILRVIFTNEYFYNRTVTNLVSWVGGNAYSDFLRLSPVQVARFVPWFGDFLSYFSNPINWIFCGLIVVIALGGYFFCKRQFIPLFLVFCISILASLGLLAIKKPIIQPIVFDGGSLPGNVGRIDGLSKVARKRDVGFVSRGPYLQLLPGTYEITLKYGTDNPISQGIKWDCSASTEGELNIIDEGSLPLSQVNQGKFTTLCVLPSQSNFEFRVFTEGDKPEHKKTNDKASPLMTIALKKKICPPLIIETVPLSGRIDRIGSDIILHIIRRMALNASLPGCM